ncbi:hypothetical protein DY000_02048812 [Brassica cretica]|uniref:Uncharacterized protein n=1 Tax=Brassica cretica TaxID=69181 RepID=A0ABQ7F6C1_BRACR|nr:hypothetical protein DY000_02048812 [Brassica cretica]
MKLHAHCSTSTALLTGSGHDLQLISRVPPCSLKHIDASCSLQHNDRFIVCSGHVPSRTYDFYQLQSYMLPELCAPRTTCSQRYVLLELCALTATCSQSYVPTRLRAH